MYFVSFFLVSVLSNFLLNFLLLIFWTYTVHSTRPVLQVSVVSTDHFTKTILPSWPFWPIWPTTFRRPHGDACRLYSNFYGICKPTSTFYTRGHARQKTRMKTQKGPRSKIPKRDPADAKVRALVSVFVDSRLDGCRAADGGTK